MLCYYSKSDNDGFIVIAVQVNVLTHAAKVKIPPWQQKIIKKMQKKNEDEDLHILHGGAGDALCAPKRKPSKRPRKDDKGGLEYFVKDDGIKSDSFLSDEFNIVERKLGEQQYKLTARSKVMSEKGGPEVRFSDNPKPSLDELGLGPCCSDNSKDAETNVSFPDEKGTKVINFADSKCSLPNGTGANPDCPTADEFCYSHWLDTENEMTERGKCNQ